ncbi:MAG: hypothetical protein J0L82_19340 [Deltaproteobacteria bacterium]|jgi:hypothetical protein|nr:hypothetical protein [Deltaproteobacteria bacterium]
MALCRISLSFVFSFFVFNSVVKAQDAIQDFNVIMDIPVLAADGSRMTVEFGKTSFENLPESIIGKIPDGRNVLPSNQEKAVFHLLVPKEMKEADRKQFVERLVQSFGQSDNDKLEVKIREVDVVKIEKEQTAAIGKISERALEMGIPKEDVLRDASALKSKLSQHVSLIRKWGHEFIAFTRRLSDYRRWPLESKYMLFGALLGGGKSIGSVGFWLGTTGVNPLGIAQALMSVTLDVVFSVWGQRIESWKGRHTIPEPKNSVVKKVTNPVRLLYNENTFLKAFLVNNLIGVSAGGYFRWLSWWADTSGKIQPPWSMDFVNNMAAGITIGGVAGAAGAQGNRTLRRKGYYGSGTENLVNQTFGLSMMIGGFLNGRGNSELFMAYLWTEAVAKSVLYGASKMLPNRAPRVFVFHPEISAAQIEDFKFRFGIYDAEKADPKNFPALYNERSSSKNWTDRARSFMSKTGSCESSFVSVQ